MNQHDLKIIIDAQNQSRDALADFSCKLNEQVCPALQLQKQLDDLCKKMVPIPPTISRS